MSKKIWVIAVTLPLLLAAGLFCMWYTNHISNEYGGIVRQVEDGARAGDFAAAQRALTELAEKWDKLEPGLQMWITHFDTDVVSECLRKLQAALTVQDPASIFEQAAELTEAIDHLHHRDDLTWSNIL